MNVKIVKSFFSNSGAEIGFSDNGELYYRWVKDQDGHWINGYHNFEWQELDITITTIIRAAKEFGHLIKWL